MTSRPHVFLVRSSDDRLLGAALIGSPAVNGVELTPRGLQVRAADFGTFTRELAGLAGSRAQARQLLLPTSRWKTSSPI